MAIAIDFGTSNTVITRWNPLTQTAETLSIPGYSLQQINNPPVVPSLVYVENAQLPKILIGQQVRDQGLDLAGDGRFFRNFKRGIGADIQGFLPPLDGVSLRFEQVGTWFLTHLLSEINLEDSLILTVPVDSFEPYRHWLGQVCQSLSVDRIRMIDEPTAAALGYGVGDRGLILVVDLGGGTLDLALVQLDGSEDQSSQSTAPPLGYILKWGEKSFTNQSHQAIKTARAIAKMGLNLGGSDLDHWIADGLIKTHQLTRSPSLTRIAEKLKIQLSVQQSATEVYFDRQTLETHELTLNRKQFLEILESHQFFDKLEQAIAQVLQQARREGIEKSHIEAVLLVGGTSQIPSVQAAIKQIFGEKRVRCDRPLEAIALGALQLDQGLELKDFLYHSYGIRYWNRRTQSHAWHPIIKEGQPYPMSAPVELTLGTSVPQQPKIELIMAELGSDTGGTEIYFDGDRLITQILRSDQRKAIPLNDSDQGRAIAHLNPPGVPGSDRVKIFFQVDSERFLRITVEDLLTHQILLDNQPVVQLT